MSVQVVVLERITRRAPLGMRLLDLVRGAAVTDGLVVTARELGRATPVLVAQRSPFSGVYGFRSLPGLRGFEIGERPAVDWCSSPPEIAASDLLDDGLTLDEVRELLAYSSPATPASFVVTVTDTRGRFLPVVLTLCLPREHLLEIPLFSAPARPSPPGLAAVRGELRRADDSGPASWAMVTATVDEVTHVGLADRRGVWTVFLPYASPLPPPVGSPASGSVPLDALSWPTTVRVFYEPGRQRRVEGSRPEDPPDARSILEQGAARIHDRPAVAGLAVTRPLRLHAELVVATQGRSELLVEPA